MLALALALISPLALQAPAAKKPAADLPPAGPTTLEEPEARALVARYRENELWTLRSIVLTSLGPRWHPSAAPMLAEALEHRDVRLRAFALEALRSTDPARLPCVATPAILESLIKQVAHKNQRFREGVLEVLRRIAPSVPRDDVYSWQTWWQNTKGNYALAAWPAAESRPAQDAGGPTKTAVDRFVARAVDLSQAPLEVVFCVDSTGSMQQTIDAACDALRDVTLLLGGISPKLRIGLVHFKDVTDFPEGAKVLARLDEPYERTTSRLEHLTAAGGGDIPESVELGLALAADPKELGWTGIANKVIVLLGDATPHSLEKAKTAARDALEKPLGKAPAVVTGEKAKKETNRPIFTSAIQVGVDTGAESSFKAIAAAGGGLYGKLSFDGASGGAESVVAHLLTLSFGRQFEREARRFVDVYLQYRRDGFFK